MYKFSLIPNDDILKRIAQEAEDNFITKDELPLALPKKFQASAPKLSDMSNGESIGVDDGTNQYLYIRVAARLFRLTLTEV